MLEDFSPQLDVESIMVKARAFNEIKSIKNNKVLGKGLLGLGSKPNQVFENISEAKLDAISSSLQSLLEEMYLGNGVFVARLNPRKNQYFEGDYDHLSRFGEWAEFSTYEKLFLSIV